MAGDLIWLNDDWLHQWCAGHTDQVPPPQAFEVAARLKNLAVWWLRPEVLQRAAAHARQLGLDDVARQWQREPQLPTEAGACWIAVVNKYPAELGLLRPAYALPLRWDPNQRHDRRLPAGLRALADEVCGELKRLSEVEQPWGLLPSPPSLLCGLDLSTLEGRWDSAFAPLAVGLLLATWEGKPDPTLWASGTWSAHQGIQAVEGLQAKLQLAESFAARMFFVPQPQADALRDWAKERDVGVEVRGLRSTVTDLREALGEYLEQHGLVIGPGPHLRAKRAEHFHRIHDDQTAQRFYRQHVLPDVVEDLRQRVPSDLASGGKKLVTIVSKGFDLIRLAVLVFRPAQCLLLHDRELAADAVKQKEMIEREAPACRAVARWFEGSTREELLAAFRQAVEQFAGDERPENLVFDLTGGKRIMNLALYDAVPSRAYVICVQSDFDPQRRRPVLYSEKVHTWRAKDHPIR